MGNLFILCIDFCVKTKSCIFCRSKYLAIDIIRSCDNFVKLDLFAFDEFVDSSASALLSDCLSEGSKLVDSRGCTRIETVTNRSSMRVADSAECQGVL